MSDTSMSSDRSDDDDIYLNEEHEILGDEADEEQAAREQGGADDFDEIGSDEENDEAGEEMPPRDEMSSDLAMFDFLTIEQTKGKLRNTPGGVSLGTKALVVLIWLREQQKAPEARMGLQSIGKVVNALHNVALQKVQVRRYVSDRGKIVAAYKSGRERRSVGGGRRTSVISVEKEVADKVRASQVTGDCLTAMDVMKLLGTTSVGVYRRFLRRHSLSSKAPEVQFKIRFEELQAQMRKFHEKSATINKMIPLSAQNIVQLDEIALSLGGSLSSLRRRVVSVTGAPAISRTCALYDHRKIATGMCFLSDPPIPPLIIMKGGAAMAGRYCDVPNLHFTDCANTTETFMIDVVLPHIKQHNPNVKLVIFDSATCHLTDKVFEAVRQKGLWYLAIPANATSFLQALDVYYFSKFRQTHGAIVDAVVQRNGKDMYSSLSSDDKRRLLVHIVTKTAECLKVDVEEMFVRLGYINPTAESIRIPHMAEYTFTPPSDEWLRAQTVTHTAKIVESSQALVESSVEAVASTEITGTRPKRARDYDKPRPRVVEPCTCGHGDARGRHKKDCERHKEKCQPPTQAVTPIRGPLDAWLRPKAVPPPTRASSPPPRALAPVIDVESETEQVLFPDGPIEFRVIEEESLWSCSTPGTFMSSRTLTYFVRDLRDTFPNFEIYDSLEFENMKSLRSPNPHLVDYKVAVVAYHDSHFVAFGYDPFTKTVVGYDSLRDHFDDARRDCGRVFCSWLERGGNEILQQRVVKTVLQPIGSNDCGFHAINNIVWFLTGVRGKLDRIQVALKRNCSKFQFFYHNEDDENEVRQEIREELCSHCASNLRVLRSRATGASFLGCISISCCNANNGPFRMRFPA